MHKYYIYVVNHINERTHNPTPLMIGDQPLNPSPLPPPTYTQNHKPTLTHAPTSLSLTHTQTVTRTQTYCLKYREYNVWTFIRTNKKEVGRMIILKGVFPTVRGKLHGMLDAVVSKHMCTPRHKTCSHIVFVGTFTIRGLQLPSPY